VPESLSWSTIAEGSYRLRLPPERGAGSAEMEVEGSERSRLGEDLRRELAGVRVMASRRRAPGDVGTSRSSEVTMDLEQIALISRHAFEIGNPFAVC
jgi:hypothetical protein